jgi:hypothetical protein
MVHYRVHKNWPLVLFLSQMNPIHTPERYFPMIYFIIPHLRVGRLSGDLPSGFPTKILYAFLIFPMCTICSVHLVLLDLMTLIIFGKEYTLWSTSLCSFLAASRHLYLIVPNTLLSTLFSNTLSLCSYFNARDQVSHPFKTTGKNYFVYILIFTILDIRRETEGFERHGSKHSPNLAYTLISSWMKFWFFSVVSKYLKFAVFPKVLLAIFVPI